MGKRWSVKEVRELTGLTGKHLHYFHHEGVVLPVAFSNFSVEDHYGYKLYDEAGVAKLQQIAMYYELGLRRDEIRDLMKAPGYDMNRALDDLQRQMEEKCLRLQRHIAAVEQLRLIGTKNGLMDWFRSISLEDLGKNMGLLAQSPVWDCWNEQITARDMKEFQTSMDSALKDLNQPSISEKVQMQIIGNLVRAAVAKLGMAGYLYLLGVFASAAGEGTLLMDLQEEIPVRPSITHGKLAIAYLEKDADAFLDEVVQVIADHHEAMDLPVDDPQMMQMVSQIKALMQAHFGIRHDDEYREILKRMSCDDGYLQKIIDAMKYSCGIC